MLYSWKGLPSKLDSEDIASKEADGRALLTIRARAKVVVCSLVVPNPTSQAGDIRFTFHRLVFRIQKPCSSKNSQLLFLMKGNGLAKPDNNRRE